MREIFLRQEMFLYIVNVHTLNLQNFLSAACLYPFLEAF
jgi:hypothetical protein